MAGRDYPNPIQSFYRDSDIAAYAAGSDTDGAKWAGNLPGNDEVYNKNATSPGCG